MFSWLFHSHNMHLLGLLDLYTDRDNRFPHPFKHFNKLNPYPFMYLMPEKDTPFGRSLPPTNIGSTPGGLGNLIGDSQQAFLFCLPSGHPYASTLIDMWACHVCGLNLRYMAWNNLTSWRTTVFRSVFPFSVCSNKKAIYLARKY